jgi:protein O-GlcNAc transferase
MSKPPGSQRGARDLPQALRQAVALHQRGNPAEAEKRYRAILAMQPDQPDALHLLGVVRHQQGDHAEAQRLLAAAVEANPNSAVVRINHGLVLQAQGDWQGALMSFERALALAPNDFDALFNRAYALAALGRNEDALAGYGQALAVKPDSGDLHYNRGNALNALGRCDEALASYERALALAPGHAGALNNRGNVLARLGRHQEALASYEGVLARDPGHAEALANRGSVLQALDRHAEALASYDQALAAAPDNAEALRNRGNVLKALNRHEEALASYDRALALEPGHAPVLYNRGLLLHTMNRGEDALASFEQALALNPDYAEARLAVCMAQLPVLYLDAGEIDRQRAAYQACLDALCEEAGRSPGDLAAGVGAIQPFYLAYQGRNDRDLQARYGSLVCRAMAERFPPAPLPPPPRPQEPVRVGIVSGFFRDHSNWKMPIKGWLKELDRRRFRLFGYHTGARHDADTAAAAALCERFVQGPLSIERWREAILYDAPHVLIYPEVGMDPVSAPLAAQRLAPVQCNSWGHPDTSGFPTLDYYLSSERMEPPDGDEHYTERLIRLPNLSVYCEPSEVEPVKLGRRAFGMRPGATVYWCGQSLFKYLPQYDEVFPRIAREVGDCQFVFIEFQSRGQVTGLFGRRMQEAFAAHGLKAADHCVGLQRLDQPSFIAAIGLSDIVLDSLDWSGCNSTLECLSHDLPIVTMTGPLMRGRHSTAILEMMGVTDTIAATVDAYVATAVRLAKDASLRAAVKSRIAANKHRLYRDRSCIAGLEAFLDRVARHSVGSEAGGARRPATLMGN